VFRVTTFGKFTAVNFDELGKKCQDYRRYKSNIQIKMPTWARSRFLSSASTSALFCPWVVGWL